MRIWGYWATLGWALLAFLVGQFAAVAVLIGSRVSSLNSLMAAPFDGAMVALFLVIANPITIALVALAVRLARAPQVDYLALKLPPRRDVWIGLAGLVALIAVGDVLLYVGGHPLVTPFQLQSYTTAAAEGWLPALLVAAIVIAPAGEEILFRGFLFRGWVRPDRNPWPAIAAISILWAALHIQYDWTGIVQIFAIGLFLGWMRARSGSVLLTFVLHALFNLEGTLETVLLVHLS